MIGQLNVVGTQAPEASYITAADIGAPLVTRGYSAFGQAGLKLKFAPGAFLGDADKLGAEVVIVIR